MELGTSPMARRKLERAIDRYIFLSTILCHARISLYLVSFTTSSVNACNSSNLLSNLCCSSIHKNIILAYSPVTMLLSLPIVSPLTSSICHVSPDLVSKCSSSFMVSSLSFRSSSLKRHVCIALKSSGCMKTWISFIEVRYSSIMHASHLASRITSWPHLEGWARQIVLQTASGRVLGWLIGRYG